VRSKFGTEPTAAPMGQRARFTWSTSADGTVACPYISFLDLSERELPKTSCPSGVLMIPIEGLAVGGVNPECKSLGYLVFVRKGEDMETANFTHYRNEVFRSYVHAKRKIRDGVPLSEEERAVSWQDGGGPQLKTIMDADSLTLDDEMKLTVNNHSASRSAVEQMLDLMRIFKILHRTQKSITVKSRPLEGYKLKVYTILRERQTTGELCVSRDKLNCIIDFATCLPEILTTSVTQPLVFWMDLLRWEQSTRSL